MKTLTIDWLNKCRCGNKSHSVKTARGNESALWDDDTVKCNSCGRGGVIQVCEGQARVLWETDEEMAEGKPMSTITKERVAGIASGEKCYTHDDVVELARIALASLEAEPVAWAHRLINKRNGVVHPWVYGSAEASPSEGDIFNIEVMPLYTAPPAPEFVSDESAVELLATDLMKRIDKITGERHSVATLSSLRVSIVEACRAAMLQGAGGNSPVIPDGWVACSERMPDVGVKVLCFPVNDEPIHATYNGQVWLQDISWSTSDEPIDNVISCNVFHWMTLPAAPQQEVK
ncbi:DUF551 domain-containing protein [Enterobacter hormaechei]|uniref:DUF551 domain-containing protein n=1 Tax=Enterobacter hormaechei TaxID=158836 RepID=UPI0013E2D54C|nr:DUF551 domain-containing protein [Enterobacter hormaechei]